MFENYGFKFKIGDILESVFVPDNHKENEWPRSSQKYLVVERILQECPGGIQHHYTLRSGDKSGAISKEYIRMNEIELKKTKGKDA